MPQKEVSGWTCPLCTVVNDAKIYICTVCGARKQTSSRRARFSDTILAQQMQSEILITQEKEKQTIKRSQNKKSSSNSQAGSENNLQIFDETSGENFSALSPAISTQSKDSRSSQNISRKRKYKDQNNNNSKKSSKNQKTAGKDHKNQLKKDKITEENYKIKRNPNKKYLNVRGYSFYIPEKPDGDFENLSPVVAEVTFQGLTLKISRFEKSDDKNVIASETSVIQESKEREADDIIKTDQKDTADDQKKSDEDKSQNTCSPESQSPPTDIINGNKAPTSGSEATTETNLKLTSPTKTDKDKEIKQPISLNGTPTRRLLKSTEKRPKRHHQTSNSDEESENLEPRLTRKNSVKTVNGVLENSESRTDRASRRKSVRNEDISPSSSSKSKRKR